MILQRWFRNFCGLRTYQLLFKLTGHNPIQLRAVTEEFLVENPNTVEPGTSSAVKLTNCIRWECVILCKIQANEILKKRVYKTEATNKNKQIFRSVCNNFPILSFEIILADLDFPIMSLDARKELFNTDSNRNLGVRTPVCLAASSLAGSCMSKVRILKLNLNC